MGDILLSEIRNWSILHFTKIWLVFWFKFGGPFLTVIYRFFLFFFVPQQNWGFLTVLTGFSAQSIYIPTLVTFWNITLTALPPICIGIWETDISEYHISLVISQHEISLWEINSYPFFCGEKKKYPETYKDCKRVPYFTIWNLIRWLLSALWVK